MTVYTPAEAVLKERNLSKTLSVLCAELEYNYKKEKRFIEKAEKRTKARRNDLISLTQRAQQISLMLYSLPSDYVFDITYACEQATALYDEFNRDMNNSSTSFNYSRRLLEDVNRYDGLIHALEKLPPSINQPKSKMEEIIVSDTVAARDSSAVGTNIDALTEEVKREHPYTLTESEQKTRETCIMYAKALRNNYVRFYNYTKADERYYKDITRRTQ